MDANIFIKITFMLHILATVYITVERGVLGGSPCVELLQEDSPAYIRSANFPGEYTKSNTMCWNITVHQSMIIVFETEVMDLDCDGGDNVIITDNTGTLKEDCDWNFGELRTTTHIAYVTFTTGANSSSSTSHTGFKIYWYSYVNHDITYTGAPYTPYTGSTTSTTTETTNGTTTETGLPCVELRQEDSPGYIESDNFPGEYTKSNTMCWNITDSQNAIILFKPETMDINCDGGDNIIITDNTGTLVDDCKWNSEIRTTTHIAYVTFTAGANSSSSALYQGFRIYWYGTVNPGITHTGAPSTPSTGPPDGTTAETTNGTTAETTSAAGTTTTSLPFPTKICEGEKTHLLYVGPTGVIAHPNYPNNYESNWDCVWNLTVPDDKRVSFKVTDVDIEGVAGGNCDSDYLLFQSNYGDMQVWRKLCGKIDNAVIVSQRAGGALVTFHSDSVNNYNGFVILWEFIDAGSDNSSGTDGGGTDGGGTDGGGTDGGGTDGGGTDGDGTDGAGTDGGGTNGGITDGGSTDGGALPLETIIIIAAASGGGLIVAVIVGATVGSVFCRKSSKCYYKRGKVDTVLEKRTPSVAWTTEEKIVHHSTPISHGKHHNGNVADKITGNIDVSNESLNPTSQQLYREPTEILTPIMPVIAAASAATVESLPKKSEKEKDNEDDRESEKPHIMISYQWDVQKEVLKFKNRLKAEGYRVWIDVEQIHKNLSTFDSMVDAVDRAVLVIPVLTAKYQQSINCRKELEYADKKHRPIVPIRLQEDYMPEKWLSFLLGNTLWHDMYSEVEYDSKMEIFFDTIALLALSARKDPTET